MLVILVGTFVVVPLVLGRIIPHGRCPCCKLVVLAVAGAAASGCEFQGIGQQPGQVVEPPAGVRSAGNGAQCGYSPLVPTSHLPARLPARRPSGTTGRERPVGLWAPGLPRPATRSLGS